MADRDELPGDSKGYFFEHFRKGDEISLKKRIIQLEPENYPPKHGKIEPDFSQLFGGTEDVSSSEGECDDEYEVVRSLYIAMCEKLDEDDTPASQEVFDLSKDSLRLKSSKILALENPNSDLRKRVGELEEFLERLEDRVVLNEVAETRFRRKIVIGICGAVCLGVLVWAASLLIG